MGQKTSKNKDRAQGNQQKQLEKKKNVFIKQLEQGQKKMFTNNEL